MKIANRLHSNLELLDEGIALYRRNFVGFLLLSAVWIVPLAIIIGLLVAFIDRLAGGTIVLIVLSSLLLALPLLVYLIGGLSRGATAAIEGRPINLREALAIRPANALGAGCFTIIYSIIMQVISSAISFICVCPLYIFGFAASTAMASIGNNSGVEAAILVILGVLFGSVYLVAAIVGGASYSSMFYALQPWVQERLRFGEALERSLDLVIFRFRANLIDWTLSALLVGAAAVSTSLAVGLLAPLPALILLGTESALAQAIASGAWLIGMALVLPPLPIWMTLLYRRNLAVRSGLDLERQIAAWEQEIRHEA